MRGRRSFLFNKIGILVVLFCYCIINISYIYIIIGVVDIILYILYYFIAVYRMVGYILAIFYYVYLVLDLCSANLIEEVVLSMQSVGGLLNPRGRQKGSCAHTHAQVLFLDAWWNQGLRHGMKQLRQVKRRG